MKKILIVVLFFQLSHLFAQNDSIKAANLLQSIKIKQVLDLNYNAMYKAEFAKIDSIFISNAIPIDTLHKNVFRNLIKDHFKKVSEVSSTKMFYSLLDLGSTKIEEIISFSESTNDIETLYTKTGIFNLLNPILSSDYYEYKQLLDGFIESTKQYDKDLMLKLTIDNKVITDYSKINFEFYLHTSNKKHKKIKVLNKKTGAIELPTDLKNDEIEFVSVLYKGKEEDFFNPRMSPTFKKLNLPKEQFLSMDPLKPDCFGKSKVWKIEIIEDPKIIYDRNIQEENDIKEKVLNFMSISICFESYTYNFLPKK